MAKRPALLRIAVNVGLDAALAGLAVPLADWLAAPDRMPLPLLASSAWGAASLLLAGLPFGLSRQYWRYAGVGELVGVAAGSLLAAALFSLGLHLAGVALPSPSFPVGLALCLLVLLAFPRIGYRMTREAPPAQSGPEPAPALLLGAGDGADLFLSALAASRAPPYRALGLLSGGGAQTGRRIQNCPVLGSLDDAPAVLARLRAAGEAPESLVVTDPALDPAAMEFLRAWAGHEGLAMVPAPGVIVSPRPTAGFVAVGRA
jgi:O-antigen biosynthesis protein WbqV